MRRGTLNGVFGARRLGRTRSRGGTLDTQNDRPVQLCGCRYAIRGTVIAGVRDVALSMAWFAVILGQATGFLLHYALEQSLPVP